MWAFLAEAKARAEGGVWAAPVGYVERLVAFWSNYFCISTTKGMAEKNQRRRVRARGDPPLCARTVRRHAEGGRASSDDAGLSRNAQSVGPDRRSAGATSAASTRTWRAKSSNCTRSASTAATARPTSPNSRASSPAGRFAGREGGLGGRCAFVFDAGAHEPGVRALLGGTTARRAGPGRGGAGGSRRITRRPPAISRQIATRFLSPTRRRRPSSRG